MQRDFQGGGVEIPHDSEDLEISIQEDLHNVQRVFTTGGNVLYYSPHNEDGHSDGASALALCLYAIRENTQRSIGAETGLAFPHHEEGFSSIKSEQDEVPSLYGVRYI